MPRRGCDGGMTGCGCQFLAPRNDRIGSCGIGRYCGLEHLDDGEKVVEVREAPAAQRQANGSTAARIRSLIHACAGTRSWRRCQYIDQRKPVDANGSSLSTRPSSAKR